MSEYATEWVRATFRAGWTLTREDTSADAFAAFDRWLAERDRQVAEQAWDEGMERGRARWMRDDDNEEYPPVNPYRADSAAPAPSAKVGADLAEAWRNDTPARPTTPTPTVSEWPKAERDALAARHVALREGIEALAEAIEPDAAGFRWALKPDDLRALLAWDGETT